MVEKSIVVDLVRNPKFFDDWNQSGKFNISGMDGSTKNYEFVMLTDTTEIPIYTSVDFIGTDGKLKTAIESSNKINVGTTGRVALNYSSINNSDRTITTQNSKVEIDFGENDYYLKAICLIDRTTKYVLAYCIFDTRFPVTEKFIFPASSMVWNIRNEV